MSADPPEVEAAFAAFPDMARGRLRAARSAIAEEARALDLGPLIASLKWGQPSYVAPGGCGTPIRLGVVRDGTPALFVHCGTTLIDEYRHIAGEGARTEGRRAALIGREGAAPLRPLIRAALTYKSRRKAAP
ncbi:DUF1801 domain-containing protein [Pikeienuella piscinae]|uniref:DUF1801 domain-containing protein n=1 Tax=Pikeienuella piscinae TaxID=2748098 RepID=A0A7L5BSY2_9RHOB|nr:DUF1801 domain-containing protein [Pikeienuella piscinae]QIE54870.1 DUF1801 domain-containing protein [Pikeienuella piscinae]